MNKTFASHTITILIDGDEVIGLSEDADDELDRLLGIVSRKGLKVLELAELETLRTLLENKNYGDNKNANKSKAKLLKQINFAFYDKYKPRRFG